MALDPGRVVSPAARAAGADGRRERGPASRLDRDLEHGPAWLAVCSTGFPLERERDEAGNDWWTLRGDSDRAVLIGGHIDSVPNGGWLDGCLNVVAGAEVLRRIAEDGAPARHGAARQLGRRGGCTLRPLSFRLLRRGGVDDATRKSCAGSLTATASPSRGARGKRRRPRPRASTPTRSSSSAAAYLELHIEQGPVLEAMEIPLGAVLGTYGVERWRITWTRSGGPRGLDADGQAPRRSRRSREARARAPGDRGARRQTAPSARRVVSSAGRGSSPPSSRRRSSSSTCAISMPTSLAELLRQAQEASERFAVEESIDVELGADLEHRADPLRSRR